MINFHMSRTVNKIQNNITFLMIKLFWAWPREMSCCQIWTVSLYNKEDYPRSYYHTKAHLDIIILKSLLKIACLKDKKFLIK